MGAVYLEQSHVSPQVPEAPELFAEDRRAQRHIAEIVGETDRLPEAPEVFTTWCSRADVRERHVFRGHLAMVIGAKAGGQERRSGRHDGSPCPRALGVQAGRSAMVRRA